MKIMKLMRRACAAMLFMLAPGMAAATDEEYEVEIIVFERARDAAAFDNGNGNGNHVERWDFFSERFNRRVQRMQKLAGRVDEHKIVDRIYRMEKTRAALREAGHRIIDTASWRQKASLLQHAPLISLKAGAGARAVLDGFVRIYTTSLIYADIDMRLAFTKPVAPEMRTTPRPGAPQYFISEKRRLKFDELHYFDHPVFGVLLGVWPVPVNEFAL